MWFDDFEPVNLPNFPNNWLESGPFDHFADHIDRSERSRGSGWLQPSGMVFEDSFAAPWRNGLEDRAISGDFNPSQSETGTTPLLTGHKESLASDGYKSTGTSPDDDDTIVVIGHRYVFDQAAWVEMRNIQYLDGYDNFTGGMNYVVAHELGHLSQAGTPFYTDQRTANDISRALLNGAQLEYLNNPVPGYGYTPNAPTQFTIG